MNLDIIKEYFYQNKGDGYEIDYVDIISETKFLISYTDNRTSMSFSGKKIITSDEVREYQINKIIKNGTDNN